MARRVFNPNGVVSSGKRWAATPLGLVVCIHVSQGSSFLATLGFEPESLWDSTPGFPKGIKVSDRSGGRISGSRDSQLRKEI